MTAFTALAPGKLNLCLYVGRPRPDGYHPLVSIVQPVSLADELTLEPAPDGAITDEVVCSGIAGENLAARALAAFRAATAWDAPPQRLTIVKRVPVAAGMGGGSGDAAAALRLAALAAGRQQDPVIAELAPGLGADVPAMLACERALMTGIGEAVEPLRADDLGLVVLPSAHALPTPAVYAEFDRLGRGRCSDALDALAAEIRTTHDAPFANDLEAAAIELCPPVADALAALRAAGARHALVSGSGPTVFGVFADAAAARAAASTLPGAIAVEPVDAAFAAARPAT